MNDEIRYMELFTRLTETFSIVLERHRRKKQQDNCVSNLQYTFSLCQKIMDGKMKKTEKGALQGTPVSSSIRR